MDDEIDRLLRRHGGACSRSTLLTALTRNQLDNEIRRGRLVAVFARAYARPWDADDQAVREVAALASVGGASALSHLSALRRWGMRMTGPDLAQLGGTVHVLVGARRHPRGSAGLMVHRTHGRAPVGVRDGLLTQRLEDAAIACWPLLPVAVRRAPLILAVQQRMTTPQRLGAAMRGAPVSAPVRNSLPELITLLSTGCQSELELWGYLSVFDVPGLRDAVRQRRVRVGTRTYYVDVAYEAERVAVELDGRAYHSSRTQWERDIARDLALATAGWQTVRLSHFRLTTDVQGCRRDVLAVRQARRGRAETA